RRHTRFSRDWSSDVCSSDLSQHGRRNGFRRRDNEAARRTAACFSYIIEDEPEYPHCSRRNATCCIMHPRAVYLSSSSTGQWSECTADDKSSALTSLSFNCLEIML